MWKWVFLSALVFAGCGLGRRCSPAESSIPPFCSSEGYVASVQRPEKRNAAVTDFACVVSADAGVVTFTVTGEGCYDDGPQVENETAMTFRTLCVIPDGEWIVSTNRGSQRIRVVDGGVDCAP